MKKVDAIDVIISLKDVIDALDQARGDDSVANIVQHFTRSYGNETVEKAKSKITGKVAKISFNKVILEDECGIFKSIYVPDTLVDLNFLVYAAIFGDDSLLPTSVNIYGSLEEAKIKAMLDGTPHLFEMLPRAIKHLQFVNQRDSLGSPYVLYCHMTFAQVKSLLKKV